ncbi:MAG: flagellar motor protein MotB [Pseudomonadota bacterium]
MKTPPRKKDGGGAPRWMTTFADLMAVLVVFFVMLYSFSTIDAEKYERLAESLRSVLSETPPVDEQAADPLDPAILDLEGRSPEPEIQEEPDEPPEEEKDEAEKDPRYTEHDEVVEALMGALEDEINEGLLDMAEGDSGVLLRFREQAAFEVGGQEINPGFMDTMRKVATVLSESPGRIRVAGHTDNVPITSDLHRSNWDLSAGRAVSVVHVFEEFGVSSDRLIAQGHAHTQPLVPNTSPENRRRNRRVDVMLTTQ